MRTSKRERPATIYVAEFYSENVHGFAISKDNQLGKDTIAFELQVPEDGKGNLDGMTTHPDGRLLSGTVLGFQVASPVAKLTHKPIVTPIPQNLPRCNYVRVSPDREWLYAAHAKVILRRKLNPKFLPRGETKN